MILGITAWIFWLILFIFFILAEIFTVNLVSIWFALGSIVALGLSIAGATPIVQGISFFIVSILALAAFLYFKGSLKLTNSTIEKTNADRIIGKDGIVIETIDYLQGKGQVKVDGQIWTAESKDNAIIIEGITVQILEIKGVKVIVKPLDWQMNILC